jgi:pyruvate carboxylase subunit B
MTGVIDQVLVGAGDAVTEGQVIIVLEAMKMFIDVMAPHDGSVTSVSVAAGDSVKEGQALLSIEAGGAS